MGGLYLLANYNRRNMYKKILTPSEIIILFKKKKKIIEKKRKKRPQPRPLG